jgi:hypothetical protein
MAREKSGAYDTPDGRRITAALSGAINGKSLAILIKLIGDPKAHLQLVFCFGEGRSMDKYYIAVEPILATD